MVKKIDDYRYQKSCGTYSIQRYEAGEWQHMWYAANLEDAKNEVKILRDAKLSNSRQSVPVGG